MSMMIFGFLFFLGIFFMFVFILFGQERVIKNIHKEMGEMRAQIASLEKRLSATSASPAQEDNLHIESERKIIEPKNVRAESYGARAGYNAQEYQSYTAGQNKAKPTQSYAQDPYVSQTQSQAPAGGSGGMDLFMPPPKR